MYIPNTKLLSVKFENKKIIVLPKQPISTRIKYEPFSNRCDGKDSLAMLSDGFNLKERASDSSLQFFVNN